MLDHINPVRYTVNVQLEPTFPPQMFDITRPIRHVIWRHTLGLTTSAVGWSDLSRIDEDVVNRHPSRN